MAVNDTRSMNQDLREGITDGVVKKLAPNRGGTPNDDWSAQAVANGLDKELYGMPGCYAGAKEDYADRLTTVKG